MPLVYVEAYSMSAERRARLILHRSRELLVRQRMMRFGQTLALDRRLLSRIARTRLVRLAAIPCGQVGPQPPERKPVCSSPVP